MATVSNSNLLGSVYRDPPLIALEAGSNTLFFEPGNRQMLMLRNPTGAGISPVISGSASGVIRVGGLVIDTSAGVAIGSIAAGQSSVLILDTRLEYLRGIVSITNAAGLIAWTVGFGISDVAGSSGIGAVTRSTPYRVSLYGDSFAQRSQSILGQPNVTDLGVVDPQLLKWATSLTTPVGGVQWGPHTWINLLSGGK